ncbi:MAG: DUF2470 domain-containing protein [Pseudonocardiaceae bacterium]
MGHLQDRTAPVPPPAERARTLAARGGTAAILVSGAPERAEPVLHHVHHDGSTVLLLPAAHPLVCAVERGRCGELSAMIELTDSAPVALRRPVRGLLWITGWVRVLGPQQARRVALEMVQRHCDDRLLDLGHGASLLRLHPEFAMLSDGEGTGWLTPADLAAAEPDPLYQLEHGWLRHLDQGCPGVLRALAHQVVHPPDGERALVRPLGVDRLGIRLRIEDGEQERDVRLPFPGPITNPGQLAVELHRLAGRPVVTLSSRPPDRR